MSKKKQSAKPELPTKLDFGVDTRGMWFSAIVLFAVLAAGIMIYRAGNDDSRIASNQTISAPARVCDSLCGSLPL
jgi:hypothetical protein